MNYSLRIVLLVLLLFTSAQPGAAQQPAQQSAERERAIQLYQQGDFTGSSQILRAFLKKQKNDIAAWHYLGLAQEALGSSEEARKSHRKAVTVGCEVVSREMKQAPAWISKLFPVRTQITDAARSAEAYINLANPRGSELAEWAERATSLKELASILDGVTSEPVYLGKEVSTKARVVDNPPPEFGSEGESSPVTLTIRGVLSAEGHVRSLFPLDSDSFQGFGLACIQAARKIRFEPAVKDGKRVSMYMEFQYSFNR